MARDRYAKQSLGVLHHKIKQAHVLLVGAGGIGCELLKNLVLTGFGRVDVIDLDTIDLSNLNRQFLFRHEHIKRPKALVAKESAARFNPNVQINAHHANIKDHAYNLAWYRSFDLVFNALDNLDARRHVNRMCLAAKVPLIESGTTGFQGQTQVIVKDKTECYDCNPKPVPKTFPVCTIRSTPSQPIHCIVWAKNYLFAEIFGTGEDGENALDHSEDADNADEVAKLRREAQALSRLRADMQEPAFGHDLFNKVFDQDVRRLCEMEDMWKNGKVKPEPLKFEDLSTAVGTLDAPAIARNDQRIWTLEESVAVLIDSLSRLAARHAKARAHDPAASLEFDKDDEDALDLVAAASNIRSLIFHIPTLSKFDVKQMAGNIIPAIATTNAMTAALCVLQSFKVLRDQLSKARMVYLERSTARAISSDTLKPPNPHCAVCSAVQAELQVDLTRATLQRLLDKILKSKLGYSSELSISSSSGLIYDPDFEDNLEKKLSELGLGDGSTLETVDEDDEPRVNLTLWITARNMPDDSETMLLPTIPEISRKPPSEPLANGHAEPSTQLPNGNAKPSAAKRSATGPANGDAPNGSANGGANDANKRKRNSVSEASPVTKKVRGDGQANGQDKPNGEGAIVLDEEGPIVLDEDEGPIVLD